MTEQQDILGDLAGRRITAVWIGEVLDVTEKTARKRLADGLTAEDVISLSRAAEVNPVVALVEMGMLTPDEVHGYLDSDGKLLASADEHDLIVELADRAMTTAELGTLIARRPGYVDKVNDFGAASLEAYRGRRAADQAVIVSDAADRVAASDRGPDAKHQPNNDGEESQDPGHDDPA